MRKLLTCVFLLVVGVIRSFASGPFTISSAEAVAYSDSYIKGTSGQLSVFVVNSLQDGATLTFTSSSQDSLYDCKWYSYSESVDKLTPIASNTQLNKNIASLKGISSDKGYSVQFSDANGNVSKYYVWLTKYQPVASAEWNKDEYYCDVLPIHISPMMYYTSLDELKGIVKRTSDVTYNVFEYESGERIENTTVTVTADSIMRVNVPTVNTPFKFTDVDFNTQFTTDTFVTYAVNAFPKIITGFKSANELESATDYEKTADSTVVLYFGKDASFRSSGPLTLQIYGGFSPAVDSHTWYFSYNDSTYSSATQYSQKGTDTIADCDILNEPGTYWVKLVVRNNASECEYETYAKFIIADSKLYIPNVFTPDGNGANDKFMVSFSSIESYECRIYNQWGRKVYDSSDITDGWDGTYHGHDMPTGVYFYVIKAKGLDGTSYEKKGTVNLIRSSN